MLGFHGSWPQEPTIASCSAELCTLHCSDAQSAPTQAQLLLSHTPSAVHVAPAGSLAVQLAGPVTG